MIIPSDPKAIAALSTSELCKYVEVLLLSLDARAVGVAATTEGITLSRLATDTTTDESIWRALYAISSELRKRRQDGALMIIIDSWQPPQQAHAQTVSIATATTVTLKSWLDLICE